MFYQDVYLGFRIILLWFLFQVLISTFQTLPFLVDNTVSYNYRHVLKILRIMVLKPASWVQIHSQANSTTLFARISTGNGDGNLLKIDFFDNTVQFIRFKDVFVHCYPFIVLRIVTWKILTKQLKYSLYFYCCQPKFHHLNKFTLQ